jgi:GNAT superfamily N-acetyltransferase
MIILHAYDALKQLGYETYSKDIEYMCKQTYELWYETYYKPQKDKYPSWETLYDIYMKLANNIETHKYIHGFVAIENNHIVGYCSMNYNDFIIKDSSKNIYTLWLSDVFVWPEYRSQGIAKNLIEIVKKTAIEMGEQIYLACEDELIKFYENKEWKLIKSEKKLFNYWNMMTYNDIQ